MNPWLGWLAFFGWCALVIGATYVVCKVLDIRDPGDHD